MSAIEVYRAAGDRRGEPVIEPLLSNDALIHRGRAEMDAHAHPLNRITLSLVFRPGVRLGQLVTAPDPASATPVCGKIVGMQVSVRQTEIEQAINVEVPA